MAVNTSAAEELFNELIDGNTLAQIQKMLAEQREESEILEFKGGKIASDVGKMKRYWSAALSGFANNQGGVLVWGVDARRTNSKADPDTYVDVARTLELIQKPIAVAETLKGVLLEAVQERLPGVKVETILDDDDTGLIICFVPEGKHKPYRAMLEKNQPYMQRIRSDFVPISHNMLRSLFYPELVFRAVLRVEVHAEGTEHDFRFYLECDDMGQTIESPVISIRDNLANYGRKGMQWFKEGWIDNSSPLQPYRRYVLSRDIHPGEDAVLPIAVWEESQQWRSQGEAAVPKLLEFRVRLHSRNAPSKVARASFEWLELSDGMVKRFDFD